MTKSKTTRTITGFDGSKSGQKINNLHLKFTATADVEDPPKLNKTKKHPIENYSGTFEISWTLSCPPCEHKMSKVRGNGELSFYAIPVIDYKVQPEVAVWIQIDDTCWASALTALHKWQTVWSQEPGSELPNVVLKKDVIEVMKIIDRELKKESKGDPDLENYYQKAFAVGAPILPQMWENAIKYLKLAKTPSKQEGKKFLDPFELYKIIKKHGPVAVWGRDVGEVNHVRVITGIKDEAEEGDSEDSKFKVCYRDSRDGASYTRSFLDLQAFNANATASFGHFVAHCKNPQKDAKNIRAFDTRFYVEDNQEADHYHQGQLIINGAHIRCKPDESVTWEYPSSDYTKYFGDVLPFDANVTVNIKKDTAEADVEWLTIFEWTPEQLGGDPINDENNACSSFLNGAAKVSPKQ